MNIGIDLDGVVFDTENLWRTIAVFYDKEINGKGIAEPSSCRCQEMFDWSKKQEKDFLDKYLITCEEVAPLMPYAKETINLIHDMGHKIHIITRRGVEDEKEIKLSLKKLKDVKIDSFNFSIEDKLIKCQELNIDIMIDDNCNIISTLANNNFKCLYFRSVYANKIDHRNVTEVHNWGDVFREISKI